MTWTCPTCDRDYPDSGIGVPKDATAEEMEGCEVCWVSPAGTARYVRPDSVDANTEEVSVWLGAFDMDHLRDGQPVYKQGSGETLLVIRRQEESDSDE